MSINTTANTASTTKLNKTFYDRQLLESAKTRFVHAKYGQKRPIPKNSGKRVEFRKWNLFDANDAMEALQEGVTPASQALSQSNVEVEVAQYGAYVEVSDLLDMTGYDQVISESAEQIYSGEIGRLFGVVFVESTEAKVFSQSVLNKVKTATSSSKTFVLKNSPKDAEAAYLSTAGNKIKIGTAEYTVASFDAATNTVTLSDNATLTADAIVYSEDAGSIDGTTKAGADVHSTLIFGKDAYGIVDVGGSGALQIIIKPHGSAGTSDPLDQRATVGAKVAAYAAKILNELWIIRIEHGVSA